jgi:Metallo-peptidase family M12B Reprolysin-like
MSRVFRILATGALLSAALPAAAFNRETTAGSPGQGTCLWWDARDVRYEINAEGVSSTTPSCATPADAEVATSLAMATWGNAQRAGTGCTDFSFEPAAAPTTSRKTIGQDGHNVVIFRKGLCGSGATPGNSNCWPYGDGNTIAITHTFYDPHTGQIFDADMEIFGSDGIDGKDLSCGASAVGVDVRSVVVHEAGHMLGLDHMCTGEWGPAYQPCTAAELQSVMNPQVGFASQRTLAPDDVDGVCKIYPKGGATAVCPPLEDNSGGGCTSAGGAGIAVLLAALLPLARLRRRARR